MTLLAALAAGCAPAHDSVGIRLPGSRVDVAGAQCEPDPLLPGAVQASGERGGSRCAVDAEGTARCEGTETGTVQLLGWPPIRQVEVIFEHGGYWACVLLEQGGVWCAWDDALGPRQESWVRIRNSSHAVMISGSCLLRQNGGVWCWEDDEAAWMGVSGAIDLAATSQAAYRGCVRPPRFACVAHGGGRTVRCRSTEWGDRWRSIDGSEGAVQVVILSQRAIGCARFEDGRVACWNMDPSSQHGLNTAEIIDVSDAVALGRSPHGLVVRSEDGCKRRLLRSDALRPRG